MMYTDVLGSDYDFTQYELDVRHYFPIRPTHTLAFQGLFESSTGEPPFQQLALLGGGHMMRGYYEGQYRDKNMIALQMEYRVIPVWWRVGVVGFLGVGDVSDTIGSFGLSKFKTAGGLGFRYQFNLIDGSNLRADIAYADKTLGYYLAIRDAF